MVIGFAMAEHSFKLELDDIMMIERVLQRIKVLTRQICKEVDFVNTIFRAASAEAKLADKDLLNFDVPKKMINPDGQMNVQVKDGKAIWTLPDEGEGGGKENVEESDEW
jgi:hypothetical protein